MTLDYRKLTKYFLKGSEQPTQASSAVANIRPKPRIAWHRRPLFSPGLDGEQLVENLDGPGSEEWTFREATHSQSVCVYETKSFHRDYHITRMYPIRGCFLVA